ncbi:MAG: hypothetical protein ACRENA_06730 [Vulcanimicrobiaceae bacterium]
MRCLGNAFKAVAGIALAALLLAAPVSAQTNGNAANPPAAYGNSGSSAAGPGTGAADRYNNRSAGGNGGGWGIWGLVGLLGLFGLGYAGRGSATTYREEMPRSGRPSEVNTITDAPPMTTPRSGVPPSGVPPSDER